MVANSTPISSGTCVAQVRTPGDDTSGTTGASPGVRTCATQVPDEISIEFATIRGDSSGDRIVSPKTHTIRSSRSCTLAPMSAACQAGRSAVATTRLRMSTVSPVSSRGPSGQVGSIRYAGSSASGSDDDPQPLSTRAPARSRPTDFMRPGAERTRCPRP